MQMRARGFWSLGPVAVVCVLGAASATGVAAAETVKGAGADELRPLYATPADVADGKRVAEAACAGCHGIAGASSTVAVPHLAGQRPSYLYIELKAYRSGARGDSAMGSAVKFLSDEALVKVAAYYASLEPPPPIASPAKAAAAKSEGGSAIKAATAACASCHGDSGSSKTPGVPSLAGLDAKYLVLAMKAYKDGQRKDEVMKPMLASLSDAELDAIGVFYAGQRRDPSAPAKAGDTAAGKSVAAVCVGCHDDKPGSGAPLTPSLAGQDAQYLVSALKAYRSGVRADDTMKALTASLDDAAVASVSRYYAALQPPAGNARRPMTVAEWAQRCDRCHGVNGNSTDPRLPLLAGQRADYLQKVLHAYQKGERSSPQMAAMSEMLTAPDVESLAAHYARQKPRPAVYVLVPAR